MRGRRCAWTAQEQIAVLSMLQASLAYLRHADITSPTLERDIEQFIVTHPLKQHRPRRGRG